MSRALKRMTWRTRPELNRLAVLVARAALESIDAKRWTLDIDGSVLTTGLQVERAKRGFNPHHRKNPSYYQSCARWRRRVTCSVTGTVAGTSPTPTTRLPSCAAAYKRCARTSRSRERSNSMSTAHFSRGISSQRATGRASSTRSRCDDAAAEPSCDREQAPRRRLDVARTEAHRTGTRYVLPIPQWNRTERVVIYRKRLNHRSSKSHQLDLFNPDDGEWEYSVVATNKTLRPRALWHFQSGRGAQEKTIGELKSGFGFGSIPTNRYSANTAWQKLNILAHNLMTSFQLATTATEKPRTLKRTTNHLIRSVTTLRFEWLAKAGRLLRPGGAPALRLANNIATRRAFEEIERKLEDAA